METGAVTESRALHAVRVGLHRVRTWNRSGGAGESGLSRLVEVHALQAAADSFVTVALAGSLFFSVQPGVARTRVGLYLVIAMAPFAVVAPVLGPLLDRFRHGRRFALAATMLARALLALVIGHALAGKHLSTEQTLALYPAALGVLVGQKTYLIARSAALPRVLPAGMTLQQANSRITITGVFAPGLAASVAILINKFSHLWALRVGAVVYVVAAVLTLRLPRAADGGVEVRRHETTPRVGNVLRLGQPDLVVGRALRSATALRWLSGFLLFYGAFVAEEHHRGFSKAVLLGALAVGLGVGNVVGTVVGARTSSVDPRRLALALLGVTAASTLLAAIDFGLLMLFGVAFVSSVTATVAKLSLDATIQQRVDDDVRTSTFARSETTLQLAWVVGGAIGILLPTKPPLVGFLIATAVLVLAFVVATGAGNRPLRSRAVERPSSA
jgi:MFS family permease